MTAIPEQRAQRRRSPNSPQAEREHIVRVIHSHPIYLAWLHEQIAKALMAEAERLTATGHGQAGALLAARAVKRKTGEQ